MPNLEPEPEVLSPTNAAESDSPSSGSVPTFDDQEFLNALEVEHGSQNLANPKHEKFVRAIFGGCTQIDAYHEAVSATAKRGTAKTEAARLLKRPEIADRLDFLQRKMQGTEIPITRMEAVRACTEIMRSENASPDNKLKAIDRLGKMFKWFDVPVDDPATKRPDPAFLYEFIKRSQSNHQALTKAS